MKTLAIIACTAAPAAAFDVQFNAPATNSKISESLRDASLVIPLSGDPAKSPVEILSVAQAEYGRLISVLYEHGFFGPVISIKIDGREAAGISPVSPPSKISKVVVHIETGPVFGFGSVNVHPLAFKSETPESFRSGEVATTGSIRNAVGQSITDWREIGHAKATVAEQSITANHKKHRLDAEILLAPGPRLSFGDLVISGNSKVKTERIRAIAGLPTGQQFHPDELDFATTRLRRTGAFKVATLSEADNIGPNNTLNVNAQIVEQKPRRFGFGAELSSLDGLEVSSFWMHRNLLGGAERLRFDAAVSGIGGSNGGPDVELSSTFTRPATFGPDTDLFITTEIELLDEETYNANLFNLEAGVHHYASQRREYTAGVGVQAGRTQSAFGTQTYTILTLPVTALHDYRDDKFNPKNGYYGELDVKPFVAVQNSEHGVRTMLDLRGYESIGPDERLTFAVRGQLGSVMGASLSQVPSDFLFYSGGGGTVRGQKFESLGVPLGGGLTSGGRSFLGLSGEIRVQTTEKLSLVGFYDLGYIGSEAFPDGNTGTWHSGAGLGVRYDVGIGPVRFDIAFPVDGPGSNSGTEFYIGIGQAF